MWPFLEHFQSYPFTLTRIKYSFLTEFIDSLGSIFCCQFGSCLFTLFHMTILILFILFWVSSQSSNDDDENEVIRGKSVLTQTFDIMDDAEVVDASMSKITDSIVNPPQPTSDSEETPTKLFLIYFCIADMSVELQSLGFYNLSIYNFFFKFLATTFLIQIHI